MDGNIDEWIESFAYKSPLNTKCRATHKKSNECLIETAPSMTKIGSKRVRLPDQQLPFKQAMLGMAKERPGEITRLFRVFSAGRSDAQTLDHVSSNPGALTAFLDNCVARVPPESPP
jgi:hypothetical protein